MNSYDDPIPSGTVKTKLSWPADTSKKIYSSDNDIPLSANWSMDVHNAMSSNISLITIPEHLRRQGIATFLFSTIYSHVPDQYRNNLVFAGLLVANTPAEPKNAFWCEILIFDADHHYYEPQTMDENGKFRGRLNPTNLKHPLLVAKPVR